MTRLLVFRVYVFSCDATTCDAHTDAIKSDRACTAWNAAKADGWTSSAVNEHYCPEHRQRH